MTLINTIRKIKFLFILAIILTSVFVVVSCGNNSPSIEKVQKEIVVSGKTSLLPFIKAASQKFLVNNPDVKFTFIENDVETALKKVSESSDVIALCDTPLELYVLPDIHKNVTATKLCVQAYSIIVHPSITTYNLSQKQVEDIFVGHYTKWKSFGEADIPIKTVLHPTNSGPAKIFKMYVLYGAKENQSKSLQPSVQSDIVKHVSENEGAISFEALTNITSESKVKKLSIVGVDATKDNVTSGKYPVWSYEFTVTNKNPTEQASRFLNFIKSQEMTTLIKNMGYITLEEMKVSR